MSVSIEGQAEMEAAMRQARAELRIVFTAAKKEGAEVLRAGVASAWPKVTGQMAQQWKTFTTQSSAGVRNNHPGAAVVEFATTYRRRISGSSNVATVHMSKGGSPPRHAFPARDRMSDQIIDIADNRLRKALTARGWLEEG